MIAGWLVVYFIFGNVVADVCDKPPHHRMTSDKTIGSVTYGGGYQTCRPQDFINLAWRPWPFRCGRMTDSRREMDRDVCTGEIFISGDWLKDPSWKDDGRTIYHTKEE